MSGTMPYLLHKSAYFEVIESLLSNTATRISGLGQLRTGASLSDLVGFDSTNLGAPAIAAGPGKTATAAWGDKLDVDGRVRHLNQDWFGMSNASGLWQKQTTFPTGFWEGFQGDPEAIVRAAIIRAIEVSLDLPPGLPTDPLPTESTVERQWPIDIYWMCQGPWFQCWVLWRQSETNASEGHVTVLISTPAASGYPLTPKITRPVHANQPQYTAPEYASPPPPDARHNAHGMWVLGHDDYQKTIVYSTVPGTKGQIVFPHVEWSAVAPQTVVCVSPAEWEGGVLHDGRPYVHP